jgi:CheY-like chemotaxis protein
MSNATILIVEDNPTNRKLLEAILRRHGYRLLLAENGELGIELAFLEKPDLILMDIQLPQISGIEAIRAIRAHPEVGNTPIIALTAHAMSDERDEAIAAGCNQYITKPIDTRTFPDQISHYFNKKA